MPQTYCPLLYLRPMNSRPYPLSEIVHHSQWRATPSMPIGLAPACGQASVQSRLCGMLISAQFSIRSLMEFRLYLLSGFAGRLPACSPVWLRLTRVRGVLCCLSRNQALALEYFSRPPSIFARLPSWCWGGCQRLLPRVMNRVVSPTGDHPEISPGVSRPTSDMVNKCPCIEVLVERVDKAQLATRNLRF